MNRNEILATVDHTLLGQCATAPEIEALCEDAVKYNTASVCIAPSYVRTARNYLNGRMRVCTVIGFPNGYSTTAVKLYETSDALNNGADEIDMVINLGALREKRFPEVADEITRIKKVCDKNILKVIIETCLLTDEEKIRMCAIVSQSGADYIKTSTGFSSGGATASDIELFKKNISGGLLIKAAGGIKTFEDAEALIRAGASRLGTSRLIKICKQEENGGNI